MDQGTLFFNSSIASCKNKEYLTTVFKHWLKSCKEFFSEHFAENRLTLWCTVAKLWCHKLCAVFFGPPCIGYNAMQNLHFVSHFTFGHILCFHISQLAANKAASSSLYHHAVGFPATTYRTCSSSSSCCSSDTARGYRGLCYCCNPNTRQDRERPKDRICLLLRLFLRLCNFCLTNRTS